MQKKKRKEKENRRAIVPLGEKKNCNGIFLRNKFLKWDLVCTDLRHV